VLLTSGLICAVLWRRWLLLAQAPAAAELAGLRPAWWDALFLVLLTVVLLVGTDSQGVVMALAMLFLPASIALPWARRLPVAMIAAVLLALVCLIAGFVLSNEMSWPLSQSVGGFGFVLLCLSSVVAWFR
jgi:ABC-type Mn2+/Zn2+ transport system permease subunit